MGYNGLSMLTVIIAVSTNELARVKTGKGFSIDPVIGGFVLGLFLFAIGSINETLGTRFNVLIIIAALLINGAATFGITNTAIKSK